MINVTLGNNVKRVPAILDPSTTIREALEQHNIDYSVGVIHLDGASLNPGDMDRSFRELGIQDKCFLLNVAKGNNAGPN